MWDSGMFYVIFMSRISPLVVCMGCSSELWLESIPPQVSWSISHVSSSEREKTLHENRKEVPRWEEKEHTQYRAQFS